MVNSWAILHHHPIPEIMQNGPFHVSDELDPKLGLIRMNNDATREGRRLIVMQGPSVLLVPTLGRFDGDRHRMSFTFFDSALLQSTQYRC
jgi:hypothetical protein